MKLSKVKTNESLDKEQFVDKTVKFKIVDVTEEFTPPEPFLHLKRPNSEDEVQILKLNGSLQNGCIEKFGKDTDDWIGNFIKIKFEKYVSNKQGISDGIKSVFVNDEEQEEIAE